MKVSTNYVKRRARIEIIPLIDIIFFLLATFVMVSLSMIKNQGIAVRLPKTVTAVAQDRAVSVTITIKENGDLYLNKEKMTQNEIFSRLTEFKNQDPEQKVFINGDELAYFGDIVTILDQIRKIGIEKVAIQTKNISSTANLSAGTGKEK